MQHYMCLAVHEQMETIVHSYADSEATVRQMLEREWFTIPADKWSINELTTDKPNQTTTMLRTRRWDRR